MLAAIAGVMTHLVEIVIRAVKEDRMDEIRMMRDMQWQVVSGMAIMHRSLIEFYNDQVKRRDVPFVPCTADIVWHNPMIIRRVGRFVGIPDIDLGLLAEV